MKDISFKKSAFTLAEVLVTLLIIGVVAALTIPQLIQSSKNAGNAARLKKVYGSLQGAFDLVKADGIRMSTLFAGDHSYEPMHVFGAKMNVVKYCDGTPGCFPDVVYKWLNGSDWSNIDTQWTMNGKAILSDGTSIAFADNADTDCTEIYGDGPLENTCGDINVDINGFKGPNIVGIDLFTFLITKTGILPAGTHNDEFTGLCGTGTNGHGCATKVLAEGEINY